MYSFRGKKSFTCTKLTSGNKYFKGGPHLRPSEIGIFKGMTQIRDKLQRSCGDRGTSFVSIVTPRKSTEPASFLLHNFISALFILILCNFLIFPPYPQLHSHVCKPPTFPICTFLFSSAWLSVCHMPKESAQSIICSFPHSPLLWRCSLLLTCYLSHVLDLSNTPLGNKSPALDTGTGMLLSCRHTSLLNLLT